MRKIPYAQLIGLLRCHFPRYTENWNYYHSILAGRRMKQLINSHDNARILITAAYLHDIGYGPLLKHHYSLSDRLAQKKEHMRIGADIVRRALPAMGYSSTEVARIAHLVGIHDVLPELKKRDELLLMEADSIAQLDNNAARSSLSHHDMQRYLQMFAGKRLARFITPRGRRIVTSLYRARCNQYGVLISPSTYER